MKKDVNKIFIFILLISILSFFQLIKAETPNIQIVPGMNINPNEDPIEKIDEYKSSEKWEYIAQHYRESFEKNPFGKLIVKAWDFSKIPLTKVIGVQAGINWLFAIAFLIWLIFLFIIANSAQFLPFSKLTSWIISLAFTIVLGLTGFIAKIAKPIDYSLGKWWGKLILAVFLICLIIFSKEIGKIAKQQKESKSKDQEELDRQKLHKEVEVVGIYTDTITKK
ncbi:MAG: hypothetical protein ACP5OG_01400 [Candidatus Nanoarchaeia archaeon]